MNLVQRRWRRGVLLGAALVALGLACSDAMDPDASGTLLTIAECNELGGAPLFDPEDERSIDESCPEGLDFAGVFEEPFFGAEGGICCVSPDVLDAAPGMD